MILPIVRYGHPVLRQKGAAVDPAQGEIRALISDMLETMHHNHGVGLAAQQVGRALQLAVLDVRAVEDRPSWLELDGRPADLAPFMPLCLLNPKITPEGASVTGPEGCLSFPEIYAEVARPEWVRVEALDPSGRTVQFRAGGLLGRAIQHEYDHLQGILFIDRMSRSARDGVRAEIEALQAATKQTLRLG